MSKNGFDRREILGIAALAAAAAGCQGSTNERVLTIKSRKYDPWRRTTPDSRFTVVYNGNGIHFVDFQQTHCGSIDDGSFEFWFPDGKSALVRIDGKTETSLVRYDLLSKTQEVIAQVPVPTKIFSDAPSEPLGLFVGYTTNDGSKSKRIVRDRKRGLDVLLGEETNPSPGPSPVAKSGYVGPARANPSETAFVYMKEQFDASGNRSQGVFAYDGVSGAVIQLTDPSMEGYDEVFVSSDLVVFNEDDRKGLSRVVLANVRTGVRNVLSETGGTEYHIVDKLDQDSPETGIVLARRFENNGTASVVRYDLNKGSREIFVPVGHDCAVARSQ